MDMNHNDISTSVGEVMQNVEDVMQSMLGESLRPHVSSYSLRRKRSCLTHGFGTTDPNATPECSSFLTSPFDESPLDTFLQTPVEGSNELEYLTSPVIQEAWNDSFPLDQLELVSNPLECISSLDFPKMTATQMQPGGSLSLDGLIPMSPYTPSLDAGAPAMFPISSKDAAKSTSTSTRSTKGKPTGTRKNLTPDSLVPFDAPTQHRQYSTPSVTSRKELPAVFAKKRIRQMAYDDEEDELVDEVVDPNVTPVTTTEAEAIAAKRRQNTLAARRSRKRKLEHQRYLEDTLENLKQAKEEWERRANMYRDQLRGLGVNVPHLPDP